MQQPDAESNIGNECDVSYRGILRHAWLEAWIIFWTSQNDDPACVLDAPGASLWKTPQAHAGLLCRTLSYDAMEPGSQAATQARQSILELIDEIPQQLQSDAQAYRKKRNEQNELLKAV